MHRSNWRQAAALAFAAALLAGTAAGAVTFKDPTGDDNGPGNYLYPTDAAYKAGGFDLVEFGAEAKGDKVDFEVTVASPLDDPWGMKVGFATQMVFVFIDCDHQEGSGFTDTPPGLNLKFAPADKLVFAPDCGLSQTARWAAKQKLKNLVAGVHLVRHERGV